MQCILDSLERWQKTFICCWFAVYTNDKWKFYFLFHLSKESRRQTKHGWSSISGQPYLGILRKLFSWKTIIAAGKIFFAQLFIRWENNISFFTQLPETKRIYTSSWEHWAMSGVLIHWMTNLFLDQKFDLWCLETWRRSFS